VIAIALLAVLGTPAVAQPRDRAATVWSANEAPDRPAASPMGKRAPLSSCVSADNGDPVLTSVAMTPRRVDVRTGPAQVAFTVQAADTGGPGDPDGIAAARLFVHDDRVRFFEVALHEVSPGIWAGQLALHPWSEDGIWKIGVGLTDEAGHQASVRHGALIARGLPAAFTVRSVPDRMAPALTAFALDRHHVDTTRHPDSVVVTAHVKEAQSGAAPRIYVFAGGGGGTGSDAWIRRLPGTNAYRGVMRIGMFAATSVWRVSLRLTDKAGNHRLLHSDDLRRRGFPHVLQVVSATDRSRPILTALSVTPSNVDIRTHAASVAVEAQAQDSEAGVRSVLAYVGEGAQPLHLTAGTPSDGTWSGTVRLDPCDVAPAGEGHIMVLMYDRSPRRHYTKYLPQRLRRQGFPFAVQVQRLDTVPPRVPGALFDVPVAGPIVISFDEDVNGITSRSMPAFRVTGRLPEPRVSGQWTCFDVSAAETDCRTGAVRQASFQPDQPLHATATYSFIVNPVHVLALTDLAGNPALPRSAITVTTSAGRASADIDTSGSREVMGRSLPR
jgi:hypothetical protein